MPRHPPCCLEAPPARPQDLPPVPTRHRREKSPRHTGGRSRRGARRNTRQRSRGRASRRLQGSRPSLPSPTCPCRTCAMVKLPSGALNVRASRVRTSSRSVTRSGSRWLSTGAAIARMIRGAMRLGPGPRRIRSVEGNDCSLTTRDLPLRIRSRPRETARSHSCTVAPLTLAPSHRRTVSPVPSSAPPATGQHHRTPRQSPRRVADRS